MKNNNTQLPIGVFDSGMGGLTVLRALETALPHESFIYLGDTARLPYGTKSQDTVKRYAVQMARVLVEQRIKAVVIACNTASTAALSHLQTILPDVPVMGVIQPGAEAATAATRNQKIAVIATETTIASNAYQRAIHERLPTATVLAHPGSLLVALAEEGMIDNAIAKATLAHYLASFEEEDTLLLGCTHFPVFKPLLKTLLPEHVAVVDSAEATAMGLQQLLTEKGLMHTEADNSPTVTYLVTDSIQRFQRVGEFFLGRPLDCQCIQLIDVSSQ